jgi:YmgG-like glycine-zipper protein
MKRMTPMLIMSAFVLLMAGLGCRRSQNAAADSSLNRDLALAAHQRDSLDSVSAIESQRMSATPSGRANAYQSTHARSSVTHSSSAAGEVRSQRAPASSGGGVEKHTQRDAAIGAAAGAVIGATASHNKVKGGLIGAAVGGIVGAVIGNNVDKTKKKP